MHLRTLSKISTAVILSMLVLGMHTSTNAASNAWDSLAPLRAKAEEERAKAEQERLAQERRTKEKEDVPRRAQEQQAEADAKKKKAERVETKKSERPPQPAPTPSPSSSGWFGRTSSNPQPPQPSPESTGSSFLTIFGMDQASQDRKAKEREAEEVREQIKQAAIESDRRRELAQQQAAQRAEHAAKFLYTKQSRINFDPSPPVTAADDSVKILIQPNPDIMAKILGDVQNVALTFYPGSSSPAQYRVSGSITLFEQCFANRTFGAPAAKIKVDIETQIWNPKGIVPAIANSTRLNLDYSADTSQAGFPVEAPLSPHFSQKTYYFTSDITITDPATGISRPVSQSPLKVGTDGTIQTVQPWAMILPYDWKGYADTYTNYPLFLEFNLRNDPDGSLRLYGQFNAESNLLASTWTNGKWVASGVGSGISSTVSTVGAVGKGVLYTAPRAVVGAVWNLIPNFRKKESPLAESIQNSSSNIEGLESAHQAALEVARQEEAAQTVRVNKSTPVIQRAYRIHKARKQLQQLKIAKQQEDDLVRNFLGYLGDPKTALTPNSRETRLVSWAASSYNVFNQTTPDYALVKARTNADQYGILFDLAVSYRSNQNDSHADNNWILKAREMGDDDLPAAVKLVRQCSAVLDGKDAEDNVSKAINDMMADTLATGGRIGIDLHRQATKAELEVMIPALRLSGQRAFTLAEDDVNAALEELARIYLDAAFKYENLAASPNRKAVYDEGRFNSHKAHCFVAATRGLGDIDDQLEAFSARLGKMGVSNVKTTRAGYDAFD